MGTNTGERWWWQSEDGVRALLQGLVHSRWLTMHTFPPPLKDTV